MKYQLENSLNNNETLTKDQIKKAKAQEYHLKRLITKNEEKYKDKLEGYDYLVCQCCYGKFGELTSHIKTHGYTKEQYMEEFKLDSLKAQLHHDRVKGENNPAYNHGGKFSPWSKNFIKGYDEELHEKFKQDLSIKNNENKHNNKFYLEYWMIETNGDEKLAKQLYSKYQTRDLDYFINRYGEEIGTIKYNKKTEKWLTTLNNKSVEELCLINSKKVYKSNCFYSKAEKELYFLLKETITDLSDQLALCKNPQEKIKEFYVYDMVFNNKVIEYNGDFWHANPEFYDETFINPKTGQTQKEILDKDIHKKLIAEQNGYQIMYVKEHEYKKDKNKVIQECLNFLKQ